MDTNTNFPGLNKEQVARLEQVTSNLTGTEKIQAQQKLYQQAINRLNQQNYSNDRIKAENELFYKSTTEQDPKQKNYLQSNVRQEQLADLVKDKFQLKTDAKTQDVINSFINYAQDKGSSIESLNAYLESGDETILYETGLKEKPAEEEPGFRSKAGQVGADIIGGALATASALPKLAVSGLATGIGGVAKFFGADEDKVDYYVNDLKQHLEDDSNSKLLGADPESIAFNIPKGIGDLAQVAAGEGLVKGAIQGTAKGANLLNKIKNAPTRGKMLAGGIEGAGDMTLYSIIADNKLPSREEEGIGAGLGALVPGLGAARKATKNALKKGAAKLELNGIINPAKLETVKNQLIEEGVKAPENVGKWMLERGIQGDKKQIVKQLTEHAEKSKGLVDELLATSTSTHSVPEVNEAIRMLYEDYKKVAGLQNKAQEIASKMKDEYTISEMNEIKRYMDDAYNMFKMNGGETAGLKSEGLREIRKTIKNTIEDVAEQEGLGNIKLLNNETQVARSLADGIAKKDSADAAREIISLFSKGTIGGVLGGTAGGPFDGNTFTGKLGNFLVGALAGQFLFSTQAKTKLASLLNKMTGGAKKELERLVNGEVKTVSKGTEKELQKIVEDLNLKEVNPQEFTKEEASRLLGNTIVNKTNDNVKQDEK